LINNNKKTILITGGCGFIGLNLLTYIVKKKEFTIYILDNFSNSNIKNLDIALSNTGKLKKISINEREVKTKVGKSYIKIIKGDIENKIALKKIRKSFYCIIHLAAQTGVIPSIRNPVQDMKINLEGTLNLLEFARKLKIRRFIFSSSMGVLGGSKRQTEDSILAPLNPYAAGKCSIENYLKVYKELFGLETFILRFSNIYGPFFWMKNSVVSKFCKNLFLGKKIQIRGDGNQSRDFLEASDLAKIIFKLICLPINRKHNKLSGLPINLGTGNSTTINKLSQICLSEAIKYNLNPNVEYISKLKGDIKISKPKLKKIKKLIYIKNFRKLKFGIKELFNWWAKNKDYLY